MADSRGTRTGLSIEGRARTEPHPMRDADALGAARGPRRIRGIYVHVPFCFHKCHYCDFYSLVDREGRQPAYVERLRREVEASRAALTGPIETIFVGGGTPTFLEPPQLREMLEIVAGAAPRAPGHEWTVEANPETVTDEVAELLASHGVTRVSLGAQSFAPEHLATLERWHDPANVGRSIARLRRVGIRRINVDLIFGVPGSTLESWQRDVEQALELGVEHLSCYGLTYEPNTALTMRLERGAIEPCPEELEAAMYEWTIDRLAAAGFEHYEISNWAKPGESCRHNLLYWTHADWWALGPSASGHVAGTRFKNVPRISEWLASDGLSPVVDVERPDPRRAAAERVLVGLRLRAGMPEREVVESVGPEGLPSLERWIGQGLLERGDGTIRLSRRGLLLADTVLADLIG